MSKNDCFYGWIMSKKESIYGWKVSKKNRFNGWIMSKKGRMKSMAMFLEYYNIATGIKISQAGFDEETPIMSLPFYAIESFLKQ